MFNQLRPRVLDNRYGGHRLALWLFALIVSVRIVQSLSTIFNGHSVLISADGIPLDTYPPAAAQTVLAVWALSALYRLIVSLICALVLVRYRAAIPLMFALLVIEWLARQLVLHFIPLIRTGTPPAPVVHLLLFLLSALGLGLALWNQDNRHGAKVSSHSKALDARGTSSNTVGPQMR
jgi:hypothetical protein